MEQTKPKNNLPKYWAVKNDGSQLFKDTVIKYMNETYMKPNNYIPLAGSALNYYGYDGYKDSYSGCNNKNNLSDFRAAVEPLSIKEFIELSKPIEDECNKKFIIKDLTDNSYWSPKGWDSLKENATKYVSFESAQLTSAIFDNSVKCEIEEIDSKTPYTDALNKLKESAKWEPKYGERVIIGAVDGIEIEAIFLAKCKKDIFAKV